MISKTWVCVDIWVVVVDFVKQNICIERYLLYNFFKGWNGKVCELFDFYVTRFMPYYLTCFEVNAR